ncbi:MAG: DUF1343 domain-containing protein [Gemmatimonadota bacterium]|nr:MAG: DUF1343 domain-containing protein [Gemmatimonadota bacterium]
MSLTLSRRLVACIGALLVVAGCDGAPWRRQIRPGIDVLLTDSAHLVADSRVGLLTNQTGVSRGGGSDVEALLQNGVQLVAIFSPEHGFRGTLDEANIGHTTDSATGLPIYSLYGEQLEPTPEMLGRIDVLLCDLQDIGARTYTYISTILHAMRAAASVGLEVIVLDRPNPIGGELVQGPVLDTGFATYVGMLPVPLRHGMTMGELALMGNDVLGIGANVTVVPADGWRRDIWFDGTRLPWIKPSPNMPSLESATHYPGTVVFEATNVSVGRGTPIAFQVLGAPWLRPSDVAEVIGEQLGVVISDTTITPQDPPDRKYSDVTIPALKFRVTDREVYDPTQLMVLLLTAIKQVHPDSFAVTSERGFDRLAGSDGLRVALGEGRAADGIIASWAEGLESFAGTREKYLIYR